MIAAALILGLLSYSSLLGPGLLSPEAPVWRNPPHDLAPMMTGYEAVMQDRWRFPPTVSTRLDAPRPVSIVYTDSLPWLTLLLKAAGFGPDTVNPLALFYLVAHLLQGVGMILVLRAWGVRRPEILIAGAALALLFPSWLVRQFGHVALSGHFILLFALAIAIAVVRSGLNAWRTAGLAALGALAVGIHPYHVVPVAACCGVALASELAQRRPRALRRGALAALAIATATGLSCIVLGYPYGGAHASAGASTLGRYSMNLAGPILPQASALAGQRWNGVWFTGTIDPTLGQAFEGYQYLGAGILLLIGAALAVLLRHPPPGAWRRRYAPLVAACVLLTLWAIGPRVYLGPRLLLALPRPQGLIGDALGIFRSNGRFFWLAGYAALAAALAVLGRQAARPLAAALCVAAVALQVADTSALRHAVFTRYAHPVPLLLPAAFVHAPQIRQRRWLLTPTLYCVRTLRDGRLIKQASLIAIRTHGSSNSTPTGRNPGGGCREAIRMARAVSPADQHTILILLQHSLAPDDLEQLTDGRRCYRFERGAICGPGLGLVHGLPPFDVTRLLPRLASWHEIVPLDGTKPQAIIGHGWFAPQPSGTWSSGFDATLAFLPPPGGESGPHVARFTATAFPPGPPASPGAQPVEVFIDGKQAATWQVRAGRWATYETPLPTGPLPPNRLLVIRLHMPKAALPGAKPGPDTDRLAIEARRVEIAPARDSRAQVDPVQPGQ